MVQSRKKRSSLKLEMETGKKTGLYGLGPLDCSPVLLQIMATVAK